MARRERETATPRQRGFVDHYIVHDGNITKAAEAAKVDRTVASKWMKQRAVRAYYDERLRAQQARMEITADRVLELLWEPAKIDIADIFTPDGELRPIHEIPEHVRRCIASVETDTSLQPVPDGAPGERRVVTVTKVKLWDKVKALELVGRHFRMFADVLKHEGLEGLGAKLDKALARKRVKP